MDKNLVKLESGIVKLGKAIALIELSKSFCTAKDMLYDAEDIINNSFYQYIDSKNIKLK